MIHLRVTGGGAPVLLLHGAPSPIHDFKPLVGRLARRQRLLWPDLPGYGYSEPVEGKTSIARVQTAIEDALLAVGAQEVAVVGFGAGGYRALSLAIGGRVRVTDLVLLGGWAAVDEQARAHFQGWIDRLRPLADAKDEKLRKDFAADVLSPRTLKARPEAGAEVAEWLDLIKPAALADELESLLAARDLIPHVGALKVRLSARVGALDPFGPVRASEEIVKRVHGARLEVVPDCGQALFQDDPHHTLEFLVEALKAQLAPRREREE